jgi:CheY-like chemotaxis protein
MRTTLEILLIEDNEGDVELTQRVFRDGKPSCNISVANDGVEALDFLFKRGNFANKPTPQLILLDLNMPRMDGKKFLEILKEDSELKAIPVIILTSSQSAKDILECYERHANSYVVKPFDAKEYADALKQIVNFWGGLGQLPYSQ